MIMLYYSCVYLEKIILSAYSLYGLSYHIKKWKAGNHVQDRPGAGFNGGFLLGPGIGGALASLGYSVPFIGAVVFRLIAVILVVTMIRDTGGRGVVVGEERQAGTVPYRLLFTLPLVAAYLIAFGDYLYVGFDLTLMPLWATAALVPFTR